jgi:transcriptional regulator with XRE-family HTH domain
LSDPDYVADLMALQIAHHIASVLVDEGLTQRALAKRLGVSEAYLSRVLSGHPNMTLKTIAKLSLALGLMPALSFGTVSGAVKRAASLPQARSAVAESRAPYTVGSDRVTRKSVVRKRQAQTTPRRVRSSS